MTHTWMVRRETINGTIFSEAYFTTKNRESSNHIHLAFNEQAKEMGPGEMVKMYCDGHLAKKVEYAGSN